MRFKSRWNKMGFSPAQQPDYRALLRRAFDAHCLRHDLNPDIDGLFETWKRDQLMEAVGKPTSAICNHVDDYDLVMLHLATIANDDALIAKFSKSAETQMRWMVKKCLASLTLLERRECNWAYVRGIQAHMNLPLAMEDCPASMLRQVVQALDTHVRRLRRQKMERFRGAA